MSILTRTAAKCSICGKTVTPEEVEVGISPRCPRCNKKLREERRRGKHDESG
jgi:DNA-directed RNA polymerase subunit RPC12/RpoP